ncbi:LexA family protein [Gehongia tenuis]|uniref:Helix-turn-helix domain-containing protein n=1 Tax=Gehongia tenuis TaxID=2763655 RepID=A0A926HNF6_9FIRM|nr:helix-turn-helix domain-containing protein [Gehongia tenuis]MBC8530554.1 helix-turn-helix domain-containing protein [Gehongia tenuis]
MAEQKSWVPNLYKCRKRCGYTQTSLAQAVGVGKSTISKYEAGETAPSLDILVRLADQLGCSIDYIMGHGTKLPRVSEPPAPYRRTDTAVTVKVYGRIYSENNRTFYEDLGEQYLDVRDLNSCSEEYFILRVPDEAVSPAAKEGDFVLVHRGEAGDGKLVLAILDGEAKLRYLYRESDFLLLTSPSPAERPRLYYGERMAEAEILGQVVLVRRKLS